MSKKHAYLIIAHNNFKQLIFLLASLDYVDNDIFLMIDKKTKLTSLELKNIEYAVAESQLFFAKRINIYWGHYSQIAAELLLFKLALNSGEYDYFHLISGVDLPLLNQKRIHSFFDNHPKKVFLSLADNRFHFDTVINRVKYYHISSRLTGRKPNVSMFNINFYFRAFDKIFVQIQKILKIDLISKFNLNVDYASNWLSVDNDTAQLIVENSYWIKKVFNYSVAADELFIPILLRKYKYDDKIYFKARINDDKDGFQGSLNYVNWWDGSPYTWRDGDQKKLEIVLKKGHFFARKFDLEKSPDLKNFLSKIINNEK
ncbi:beta-1,6-N-acetylglucosaminyltransferase [Leuconostoc citreum]|uniref:beta-1,6-N-acetylglucosaminyltransferase n=1 Tax=Leuconostoc citreum TaxID=33964 RepID=UPI0021A3A2D3|nr:beta-1,6-N-acetylglucosaminyltransferase [Leuconostoc citreum]MCT3057818.1 hypothetical protein [Leuconostoc citreum]MCT3073637.1 hypothetical protein [Leuconostoc citreum]MDM7641795.1 beta-1,6-N-acetylglucosaminyltransferase [Leuconostoc citreum]